MKEILTFSWAFFVSVFAIPSIIYIAHLKNLLDKPDQRKVHDTLTPRLGGLAIFGGFVSSLMIFGKLDGGIQYLIAGCIILFFIGLKDDMVAVSAFKKFFVQMLAAGIIMYIGKVRIDNFQGIFGIHELPIEYSYIFSFIVIIGITNAFNLIDGLDGLAGTIIFITAGTFGLFFYIKGADTPYASYSFVAFSLVGGILGFLRYNFKNAIIFMGDTGSLISGFIISVLAIKFVEMNHMLNMSVEALSALKPPVSSAPAIAIGILFIPILDTARVFVWRILKGRSPFMPDRNHIHHLLLSTGLSQQNTVLTLALLNIAIIVFVVTLSHMGNLFLLGALVSFFAILVTIIEVIGRKQANQEESQKEAMPESNITP